MSKLISTHIGRLRAVAFLEGITLLILVFIGMPLKYLFDNPLVVEIIGPLHGLLFLLFLLAAFVVSVTYQWSFFRTTLKVLISSFIPFGTFYIDHKILKPLYVKVNKDY